MLSVLGLLALLIGVPVVVLAIVGGVVAWLEAKAERDLDSLEGVDGGTEPSPARTESDSLRDDPADDSPDT